MNKSKIKSAFSSPSDYVLPKVVSSQSKKARILNEHLNLNINLLRGYDNSRRLNRNTAPSQQKELGRYELPCVYSSTPENRNIADINTQKSEQRGAKLVKRLTLPKNIKNK